MLLRELQDDVQAVATELVLFGAVPDSLLEMALERLAALFPPPARDLVPGRSHLDRIHAETAFLAAEYVWLPADGPLLGMKLRGPTLRLSAQLESTNLNDPRTTWRIRDVGRPEIGSGVWRTTRRVVRTFSLDATFEASTSFLSAVGYVPHYQFAKRGYMFRCSESVTVSAYKIFNLSNPKESHRINLDGVPPTGATADILVVEVAGTPAPHVTQAQDTLECINQIEQEMADLATNFTGLVDLQIMNPLLLRQAGFE